MKINLRASIDQSLAMENFLKISNEHWARVLIDNPDLSDCLTVAIAEVCNFFRETNDFFRETMTPNLRSDMEIFGDISSEERTIRIINEDDETDENL